MSLIQPGAIGVKIALYFAATIAFIFVAGFIFGRLGHGDTPRKNFELLIQVLVAFGTISLVFVTVQLSEDANRRADAADAKSTQLRMDSIHQSNAVSNLQSVEELIVQNTIEESPKGTPSGQLRHDVQLWTDIAQFLIVANNEIGQVSDPAMTVIYDQRRRLTIPRVKAALVPWKGYEYEYFDIEPRFSREPQIDPDAVNVMFKFAFHIPFETGAVAIEPFAAPDAVGRIARDNGMDWADKYLGKNRDSPGHPYRDPFATPASPPQGTAGVPNK